MVAGSRPARNRSRLGALAVAVALPLVVAGCSAAAPEQQQAPPVVHPGEPGAQPRIGPAGDPDRPQRTLQVEAEYVRGMVEHHAQALRMTDLAEDRAEHPRVRALSDRIGAAQAPEIGAMRSWLDSHDLPGPADEGHGDHGGHDHEARRDHGAHAAMPGMATEQQLTELAASSGAEFDRRFLQLMSAHHEGAVRMATDLLAGGRDEQVHAMAQDVLVTQRSEIGVMRELAAEIG